ncbi:MAG: ATP-binding cassette domain-containing protein [Deltaproteobacteria bacterium]|nr:ATP-binding cassette domain-containing protein [Deltaproteobacteria bacterium]
MIPPLLEARSLIKDYILSKGILFSKQTGVVKAVDRISFTIAQGETFGLVGESGCGKSTIAKMLLLLEDITDGELIIDGRNIKSYKRADYKNYRRMVQAVFQDPHSSLNPRMRIGDIIAEPLQMNDPGASRKDVKNRVAEVLELVGLGEKKSKNYPHEFSGGQRQRVALARALILKPRLIVLDEPVSALDVSIRAQIMNLFQDIQDEFGVSYLLIAHDLAVVKHMSKITAVMYLGRMVERAGSVELYNNPLHPYTQALYSAALPTRPSDQTKEVILSGEVPSPLNPPRGCHFHPRCQKAMRICSEKTPTAKQISDKHEVICHLYN